MTESDRDRPLARGRGSQVNPPHRFGGTHHELELGLLEGDDDDLEALRNPATTYLPDHARTIVTENDSPDVGFRYSMNPYRGCLHGCSYCYARAYHEYFGLSAGLDFETKIFVKEDAPELFREFLRADRWVPEPIIMSGATDCYQPAERRYRLTRRLLEIAAEARQPISLITKNALVARDLDLFAAMAAERLIHVNVSLATLDAEMARSMEPRTSKPAIRLRAMRALADAGVPVRVLVAPVIPGLTDAEIPAILEAARDAGARGAGSCLLHLSPPVEPVFLDWLHREYPDRAAKVEGRLRSARGGRLNDAPSVARMTGRGELAGQVNDLFRLFRKRFGLDADLPPLDGSRFRPPRPTSGQLRLF